MKTCRPRQVFTPFLKISSLYPTPVTNAAFPNNLRLLRSQTGLLQSDIARAIGLASSDRISHWEKGLAVPNIINLFKLAAIYGVPPQEIYPELFSIISESMTGLRGETQPAKSRPAATSRKR